RETSGGSAQRDYQFRSGIDWNATRDQFNYDAKCWQISGSPRIQTLYSTSDDKTRSKIATPVSEHFTRFKHDTIFRISKSTTDEPKLDNIFENSR
ncbi:hypothetical protein PFISCL1PPCAC_121, partial [Pristionchus fissidentatus]